MIQVEETDSDTDEQLQNITPSIPEFREIDSDSSQSQSSDESESIDVFVSRNGVRWTSRNDNRASVGRCSYENILRRNSGVKNDVRNRVSTSLDAWEGMLIEAFCKRWCCTVSA